VLTGVCLFVCLFDVVAGAVMSDMKAGQVKQGNRAHRRNKSVNKAAQASARRRTLETKRP
jgi:hypothetical protein